MSTITASVGQGGVNKSADVLTVQKLLNKHVAALGLKHLKLDGLFGIETVGAIRRYQANVLNKKNPDGRIDVGGPTWQALIAGKTPSSKPQPAASSKDSGARWTWDQSDGTLAWDGKIIAQGYAGKGKGKNNPDLDHVQKTGPIPRGLWRMTNKYKSPNTGPDTIVLEPEPGTDTKGRSMFRIHGDNATHTASEGCIILGKSIRNLMWSKRNEEPLIEVVR